MYEFITLPGELLQQFSCCKLAALPGFIAVSECLNVPSLDLLPLSAWPGIGHCPQDEAPEVVNPLIQKFVKHVQSSGAQRALA